MVCFKDSLLMLPGRETRQGEEGMCRNHVGRPLPEHDGSGVMMKPKMTKVFSLGIILCRMRHPITDKDMATRMTKHDEITNAP